MRSWLFLFCFLLLLPSTTWSAESPQLAIAEIQKAIDTRDMTLFDQRVDTQQLVQQGTTAFQNMLLKSEGVSLPPALAFMAASATTPQTQALLHELLAKEARNFVRYGIESGHFAGKPVPGARPSGLVGPLLNDASLGRKELTVTGKPRPDNEGVRLPCSLKDFGNGRTYALDLRLRNVSGIWRVTELANLNQLVNKVSKEINNQ